jgi:hypothetical protein
MTARVERPAPETAREPRMAETRNADSGIHHDDRGFDMIGSSLLVVEGPGE